MTKLKRDICWQQVQGFYRVVMATIVIIFNFPSVYEFVTLYKKTPRITEFMPDISMTATWDRKQNFRLWDTFE